MSTRSPKRKPATRRRPKAPGERTVEMKRTAEDLLVETDKSQVEAAATASLGREPGIFERGATSFRETMREAADYKAIAATKYGLRPLLIFTVIGIAAGLDGRILGPAQLQIVRDLDLDLGALINMLNTVTFIAAISVIFLGYLADRVPRLPIVGIGTILSGVASLFTGTSTNVRSFGVTRALGDGLAGQALDAPYSSLMADYYPVEVRGKAFAFRGVLSRLFAVGAPILVGVMLTRWSWKVPYLITGCLLIGAGFLVFLLKEPVRGYMERRAMGLREEEALQPEDPPSFGEAWRTVWSIRTLRRLFISDIPVGAADFAFGIFLPLWAFERYGLTELELGYVFAGVAAATIPFGFMSGGLIDVLTRRRPQRVLVLTGLLSFFGSFAVLGIGLGPPLWAFVAIYIVFSCASALLGPARSVLFIQILPAHLRTLGTNVRTLAFAPSALVRGAVIGYFTARYGVQGGIYASVPFYVISSLIELSASGFFERDLRAAVASQVATHDWRRAKEGGRAKLLVCRNVEVEYDNVQVLFDVDLDVDEGDIIAVLGTNGAGKSTLLRAIAGVHEASHGAIVFDGRDITHMPAHEVARRGVIFMPGGRGIFPDLTVRDNLMLGNWINETTDSDGHDPDARLEEVLELFPVLRERQDARAQLLSGGEQQMLSLAQAFLSKPKLLMIDELSLGLAPGTVQELVDIVKRINREGTTVIIVEQSVNVALKIAERAVFMEKGEIRFDGKTADLLRRPDILRAVYVKGTGALTSGAPASAVKSERDLRRYGLEQARAIIEVRDVTKSFGGVTAVEDVSFDLREGEALGLIGPNGAGKTTMFDLISGYQFPDAGSIVVDGVEMVDMPAEDRARQGLVRRFQDARLFPALSVYENILVALERRIEVRSMLLTSLQVPQARQAERRVRRRAERLIELLELGTYRDKFVRELSTGLRRITDLACVLATEPKVLLLDEPSTGIAQAESESLAPLLRRVRFETGCSMLIIEHDMPLISAIADELLAMDQGKVVTRGEPDAVLNDERVVESYLGTSEDIIQRSGVKR